MNTSSLIICTRNRPNDIVQALLSVKLQTVAPEEIIVVDSSNTPLQENKFFKKIFHKNNFKTSKLIYKHTDPGLTFQRNVGVRLASSTIIHFIDDDSLLEKNYLKEIVKVFDSNQEYAGGMGYITNVGSKQYNLERLIRILFLLQRDHASGKFTPSGMPTHTHGTKQFSSVEVLCGCSSYKKEMLLQNNFDENLTGYCSMEDCDISKRVSNSNRLFFSPNAQLSHTPSPENRDALVVSKAMYIRNYRYLFFKNFYHENKFRIFAHWWSVIGLFILALYKLEFSTIKGYIKGLQTPLSPENTTHQ